VAKHVVDDEHWFAVIGGTVTKLHPEVCEQLTKLFEDDYKYEGNPSHQVELFMDKNMWGCTFRHMTARFGSMAASIKKGYPTQSSYLIPKDVVEHAYLSVNSSFKNLPIVFDATDAEHKDALAPVWIRMKHIPKGGTEVATWELYSEKESQFLEGEYNTWKLGGSRAEDAVIQLGKVYNINFSTFKQSQTGNSRRSRIIRREMVGWYWYGGDSKTLVAEWRPYTSAQSLILERAYINSRASVNGVIVPNQGSYTVNFGDMHQVSEANSWNRRPVTRVGPPLITGTPDKVYLEVVNNSNLPYLEVNPNAFPADWGENTNGYFQATEYELDPNSNKFRQIAALMNSTRGKHGHANRRNEVWFGRIPGIENDNHFSLDGDPKYFEVTKIVRVQVPYLWRQYQIQAGKILAKSGGKGVSDTVNTKKIRTDELKPKTPLLDENLNEFYMWHGTHPATLSEHILPEGFNERFGAGKYSTGCYFADISSKSNQYVACPKCKGGSIGTKPQHCECPDTEIEYTICYCRVLLGDPYLCDRRGAASPHLPLRDPDDPSKGTFDSLFAISGKESVLVYQEYVVYTSSSIYLEYVVHYKRRAHPPGGGDDRR